ncbi:hypothetical protein, partial [Streptomyces stramineus]|uniref:hypothetical protein n=1 Tax=Streptomyces stramineus TaxID=173861 RepID=UPI0031E232E7
MTEHPNSHGSQRTAAVRQSAAPAPAPAVPAHGPEATAARLPRQPSGSARAGSAPVCRSRT